MKILGIEFAFGRHFLTKPKKTWLVVDTSKTKNYYGSLVTMECCPADEFDTKEKAIEFIENNVTKNHRKNVRVYEEISL